MSYEGYEQYLCLNGHHFTKDAYDEEIYFSPSEGLKEVKCPACKEKVIWRNGVDLTNGSYDVDETGNEIRIDGYVELEIKVPAEICKCKECGNQHIKTRGTYKVPEEGVGHRL